MILDVVDLSSSINPLESMGAVSVHESVTVWSSSVREQDSNLMESLWSVLPEVEDHIWVSQVGGWVPLLGMEEVWELYWVIDEENRGVISNHIIVTLLGVEFDGEAPWISNSVWSTSLTCDS